MPSTDDPTQEAGRPIDADIARWLDEGGADGGLPEPPSSALPDPGTATGLTFD